jgi:hypothetical protein
MTLLANGSCPRCLASVSQLTRRWYPTAFNSGGSSASHASARGRLSPTTSDWSVCLLLTADSRLHSIKVKVTLRPTVSRPACLVVKLHLGPNTKFWLLSESLVSARTAQKTASNSSSVIACKRSRGHLTSTEPLPSNGCVYRAVPKQRPCLLAAQFWVSAHM